MIKHEKRDKCSFIPTVYLPGKVMDKWNLSQGSRVPVSAGLRRAMAEVYRWEKGTDKLGLNPGAQEDLALSPGMRVNLA